jgi:hypothetical protein
MNTRTFLAIALLFATFQAYAADVTAVTEVLVAGAETTQVVIETVAPTATTATEALSYFATAKNFVSGQVDAASKEDVVVRTLNAGKWAVDGVKTAGTAVIAAPGNAVSYVASNPYSFAGIALVVAGATYFGYTQYNKPAKTAKN